MLFLLSNTLEERGNRVLCHIVLFHFRSEISEQAISQLMHDMKKMKDQIETIVDLNCGKNFTDSAKDYSHALVVIFKDRQGLEIYRPHPAHLPIVKKVELMADKVERIDYEF